MSTAPYERHVDILRFVSGVGYRMSLRRNGLQSRNMRGYHAELLFSRVVDSATSVLRLVLPLDHGSGVSSIVDAPSVATLTRAIMEGYDSLWYLGVEPVPKEVYDFRAALWDYHRCIEREQLQAHLEVGRQFAQIREWLAFDTSAMERDRLRGQSVFQRLKPKQQRALLTGRTPFWKKTYSPTKISVRSADEWAAVYKLLSNHVHSHPLGVHTGRKLRIRAVLDEDEMMTICLELCVQHLALSIKDYLRRLRRYQRVWEPHERAFVYHQIEQPCTLPDGCVLDPVAGDMVLSP